MKLDKIVYRKHQQEVGVVYTKKAEFTAATQNSPAIHVSARKLSFWEFSYKKNNFYYYDIFHYFYYLHTNY